MGKTEEKLKEMGLVLPTPPAPAGSYIPMSTTYIDDDIGTAYISGQIPLLDGKVVYTGQVSDDNLDEAKSAAKLSLLNILSQLEAGLHHRYLDLDSVKSASMLSGFVNSAPGFSNQHKVMDAASNLLFEILGDRGRHARMAVGVSGLPLNAMVEISAVVEISL